MIRFSKGLLMILMLMLAMMTAADICGNSYKPGTVPNTLYVLVHFILTTYI
jgi:hypothetical protein